MEAIVKGGNKNTPHIEEVTQSIVARWGGSDKLVDDWYKVAKDSKTPHATKVRVYEGIFRLLQYSAQSGASAKLPEEMTEEEIKAELSNYFRNQLGCCPHCGKAIQNPEQDIGKIPDLAGIN